MYTQEVINIGALPNDGSGDPLRVAFEKINNNFSALFTTFVNSTTSETTGTTQQVIYEYPVATFTIGQFNIKTSDSVTSDSQTIILSAQLNDAGTEIKFSGYGSTFFGNAVSRYDMDILNGNVRVLAEPLTTNALSHYVASQVMWADPQQQPVV